MKNLLNNIFLTGMLFKKGKLKMKFKKFTRKSLIVKSWVSLVNSGIYELKDVPRLFNLREIVEEILAEADSTNG